MPDFQSPPTARHGTPESFGKNMMRAPLVCFFAIVLCLSGCGEFNGDTVFKNESDTDIWIERVEGFEAEPPVGILGSSFHSGASMGNMKMPADVVIHWSYEMYKDGFTTRLSLKGMPIPAENEALFFLFTEKRIWEVSVEDGSKIRSRPNPESSVTRSRHMTLVEPLR